MTHTEQIIQIRDAYLSGSITFDDAVRQLTEMPCSWKTKEWAERRAQKLEDKCCVCGATDKLQIQHTRHPRKIFQIRKEYVKNKMPEFEKVLERRHSKEMMKMLKSDRQERDMCPICGSVSVRYVPSENIWKCANKNNTHEFEKPFRGYYYPKARTTDPEKALGGIFWKHVWELIRTEYQKDIDAYTITEYTNDSIEYIAMTHVKTCCKRCAFLEDKRAGLIRWKSK